MYELRLSEQCETVQELLCKYSHQRRAQSPELVLLYQLVQIYAEQFEHEAEMLPVYEGVFEPE